MNQQPFELGIGRPDACNKNLPQYDAKPEKKKHSKTGAIN